MIKKLGLFGLFLACMLSATVVPFSSEAVVAAVALLDYPRWLIVLVASLGNTAGGMNATVSRRPSSLGCLSSVTL